MQNHTQPPCETKAFQSELDRLCRGHNLALRIAWAPLLYERKAFSLNGQIAFRDYAKYPLVGNDVVPHLIGVRYFREVDGQMVQVGYQKMGGIISGNVLPTDIASPDYEDVNYSIHIFVIEQRREDGYARRVWARKREIALEDIGLDPFGDFPAEGVWDWFCDVSEHREGCCAAAVAAGQRCSGLYRSPDASDLEMIASRLQERAVRAKNAFAADQMSRDILSGINEYWRKYKEETLQEGREMHRTTIRAITKPAIYLDPNKRME